MLEPDLFQLLCANCRIIKTAEDSKEGQPDHVQSVILKSNILD
jgi:hypothetical protein